MKMTGWKPIPRGCTRGVQHITIAEYWELDLKSRDSQSRRRRLINRGLLGNAASPSKRPVHPAVAEPQGNPVGWEAAQAVVASALMRIEKVRDDTVPNDEIATELESDSAAGLAAILSLLQGQRPVTWLFTGDNIVQGTGSTAGQRSCVEIFAERVRGELRRAGDVVINTGVSGDSAAQLLETFRRRVSRYRPDVVAISLGINDCKAGVAGRDAFRRTIRDLLDSVRMAGGIPLVILPHPVYIPATRKRADLRQYVEILRQEIVRDEVPCVDQWDDWLQHWPDPSATKARLADGRIQLNAAAHQHLAGLIFRKLQIFDPQSSACVGPS